MIIEDHCHWCDIKLEYVNLSISIHHAAKTRDHIVLACDGGTYAVENIVPACFLCNNLRGDIKYQEWKKLSETYITPYRECPQKLLESICSNDFPEFLKHSGLSLVHTLYPEIKEKALQDLEYMIRFHTRPEASAYLFLLAETHSRYYGRLRGWLQDMYIELFKHRPIVDVVKEFRSLPEVKYLGHWRELILMARREALYKIVYRSMYKYNLLAPQNAYIFPHERTSLMPLKETLKQAGYKYHSFDREKGIHILELDGKLEAWVANKNHASYGLIYKNTHLEFCSSY